MRGLFWMEVNVEHVVHVYHMYLAGNVLLVDTFVGTHPAHLVHYSGESDGGASQMALIDRRA